MRYASAVHQGRVDPHSVHFAIRQKHRLDSAAFVHQVLSSGKNVADLLAGVEPPFREYLGALTALALYRQLASQEEPPMPAPPRLPLLRGQTYADLPALAAPGVNNPKAHGSCAEI